MKWAGTLVILGTLAGCAGVLNAESFSASKEAFVGLLQSPSVESMGLGGSLGVQTGLMALEGNPAGLARETDALGLSLGHMAMVQDSSLELLKADFSPRPGLGYGAQFLYLNQGSFERRDENGQLLPGSIQPFGMEVKSAIGFRWGRQWALGASAAYLRQKIDAQSQQGFSLGLGSQWEPAADWEIAIGFDGLGGGAGQNPLPSRNYLGWAWDGTSGAHHLKLSSQANWVFSGVSSLGGGLQYTLNKSFWLRCGYQYGLEERTLAGLQGLGAGLGARWEVYQLDYGVAFLGDLGMQQGLTLTYHLGPSPQKSIPAETDNLAEARSLQKAGRDVEAAHKYTAHVTFHPDDKQAWVEFGKLYLRFKRNSDARICFQRALNLDPQDQELLKLLSDIK